MTAIQSIHAEHGATFGERAGRRVVEHYGRPERAHRAVRNGAGLFEPAYGVVLVTGDDRLEYVDNVVTNPVPEGDGEGCYALVLDPQGGVDLECYIYNADERLIMLTPPDRAEPLAEEWSEKVFIQDVEITAATDDFAVFGVHGPQATEKVAGVLNGSATPDRRYAFVRGSMGDAGVTVIRTDALAGEESYEVICACREAPDVYDILETQGGNAAPFGYRTWETLTLEAGSPLFESELEGTIPNVLGLRNAVDFEKGCFVGQEVVSRVENVGQPSRRLVGLSVAGGMAPEAGAAVFAGDAAVGEITRGAVSPVLEKPIALALLEWGLEDDGLTVRLEGEDVPVERTELPFVDGSERSDRLPEY